MPSDLLTSRDNLSQPNKNISINYTGMQLIKKKRKKRKVFPIQIASVKRKANMAYVVTDVYSHRICVLNIVNTRRGGVHCIVLHPEPTYHVVQQHAAYRRHHPQYVDRGHRVTEHEQRQHDDKYPLGGIGDGVAQRGDYVEDAEGRRCSGGS